jgi:hypothetical protein
MQRSQRRQSQSSKICLIRVISFNSGTFINWEITPGRDGHKNQAGTNSFESIPAHPPLAGAFDERQATVIMTNPMCLVPCGPSFQDRGSGLLAMRLRVLYHSPPLRTLRGSALRFCLFGLPPLKLPLDAFSFGPEVGAASPEGLALLFLLQV